MSATIMGWLSYAQERPELWLSYAQARPELLIGFLGQGLFASRFWVQWIVSERGGKTVIPLVFWYLSLGGGASLLCYAIWVADPVIIVGQATGLIIYGRNLMIIFRERRRIENP